jgi:hypothetical protein
MFAYQAANYFMNFEHAEADIFILFYRVMEIGGIEMFRHKDNDDKNKRNDVNVNSKKSTVLLQRISKIQDHLL